ncbi:MAG: TetR/AcrR family transcriptional regulator [Anaerolineae bacterium]
MPRVRQEMQHQETAEEIKTLARAQMRENGTAGLSLRGIARDLGVTAPAIYNYFPRLDDLITALIVDAFNAQADAMQDAAQAQPSGDHARQMRAVMGAYRTWAVDNPTDFQLIYGNPIPGYVAPAEITIPLARRPFELMTEIAVAAQQAGKLRIDPAYDTPPTVQAHIAQWWPAQALPPDLPAALPYALLVGWTRAHGIIMLEVFHHLPPTVGDVAAFYAHEVDVTLALLGMG